MFKERIPRKSGSYPEIGGVVLVLVEQVVSKYLKYIGQKADVTAAYSLWVSHTESWQIRAGR